MMTIDAGTKLGRYEIRSKIGAGGMGEVYRARDEKLNRDVAIKVLPAALSQDTDRLRRFEQEAQAAGALNHPNILAVYDVGMHDGAPYIVSELLEGEELREQLNDGSLPQRKALDYAQQIAQGLAAAHERGITHRDLKPENLFVTTDGRVKILDFGLAKLSEPPAVAGGLNSEAETRRPLTDPGTVMGTVGYMSPEQVRGHEADHRSDIFSFGSILYEMLSGQRAFRRDTMAETMTAILKEEPPELSETNAKVSLPLEKIVRRCLEKKPEGRFHSASDLGFALETLSMPSGSGLKTVRDDANAEGRADAAQTWLKRNAWLAWIVAGVLLAVALILALPYFFQRVALAPTVTRFIITPPEKVIIGESVALSPDGKLLAFSGTDEKGKTLLWIRALDTLTPQPLPGTEGARFPFWSPDSRSVGFFADSKLKKIEVSGGAAQTLAEASIEPRGATWGRDGTILFSPGTLTPIFKVSAGGGLVSAVTQQDQSREETSHRWPYLLPDDRHFIYFARGSKKETQALFVGSVDSKDRKLLLNVESNVAYVPIDTSSRGVGFLLFMRDRTLMAQPFDADRLELSGEPRAIAEDVMHYGEIGPTALGIFSISTNGVLCYQTGNRTLSQLTWFDRAGKQLGQAGSPGLYNEPALSPDGQRVALNTDRRRGYVGAQDPSSPDGQRAALNSDTRDKGDIWILELARGTLTRFTFDPSTDRRAVWSPDGSRVAFTSNRSGRDHLYQRLATGAGGDELLLPDAGVTADDWSSDGRFLLYEANRPGTNTDLWILPMTGDRKPFPFLQTEFDETHGQFSPDGRWITYVSNESGQPEVYVQSFPSSGGKWQISVGGGDQPQWRHDSKEIFYMGPDRKLMVVSVTAGTSFQSGTPAALFQTRVENSNLTGARNNYGVAQDGQRLLVNNIVEDNAAPITVVLNWTAQLKK
jgi:Tol biopolymer transport system component